MAKKLVGMVLAGLVAGIYGVAPAMADDTGLAGALHTLRREAGRNCMADHFHHGNSYGIASRKAAEVSAIQSWAGFVALEYGSDWARFAKAGSKKMDCSQSPSGWGCSVEARPCK